MQECAREIGNHLCVLIAIQVRFLPTECASFRTERIAVAECAPRSARCITRRAGALSVARVRSPSHGCAPRRTGALPVARMLRRIPVGILLRHPSPGVALRRRAECARPRKAKSILLTSPRYQAVSAYKENSPAPRFLGAGGEKDTVDVRLFQTKRNVSRSGIVHWRRPNEGRAPPAELRPPAAKGLRPLDSHDAHAGLCGRGAERRAAVPDSASPPLSG